MSPCACGCGQQTTVWRGVPRRFIHGHNAQQDLTTRFWSKVVKDDGCWEWQGTRNSNGYGMIGVDHQSRYTHRVSWELANGSIPDGLEICHRCDNRRCVRPDHLFLGTRRDNVRDMWAKGRGNPRAPRGAAHHEAKVTPQMSADILALYERGWTVSALARQYDIDRHTVRRVLQGNHWTRRAA
jgi:hypothetical protein